MLSLTECVWEFESNALWDTHEQARLVCINSLIVKTTWVMK
mgnify:FL=1